VDHKGPLLMLGPDSVVAWTGANNPGYGDPLTRDPHAVARDVSSGWLDRADATRVYAVAWSNDGAVDEEGTRQLRAGRLRARLAAAVPPAGARPPWIAGGDTELRLVGGDLGMLLEGGQPAEWVSMSGRVLLGAVTGDYRTACAVLETPVNELAPEFATRPGRPGAAILLREYLCPVSGVRLATELIRGGDEPVADMQLAGGTA
jgi:N-methylhydantoinase B